MKVLDSRQVYANPWLSVREDTLQRLDGSTGIHAVVESPDIALVIAAERDRLHLVEQYRHPVGSRRWEFPSGSAESNDCDAAALGARELREETGLSADELTVLGGFDVAPSILSYRCTVVLATELTQHEPARDVAEQDMRSQWFTRTEVEQMMLGGTISDAKTLAAYALLLLHER